MATATIERPLFSVSELIKDFEQQVDDPSFGVWQEIPVSFRKFCKSDFHMAFPPLSDKQLLASYKILYGMSFTKFMEKSGQQKKKIICAIFDKETVRYNVGVLLVGKGGGKDELSSLIILYLVYCLLCLKDPQTFFGKPRGDAIDIINVAYSSDQATNVFFEKLKQKVMRWEWLRGLYPVKQSGKYLNEKEDNTGSRVNIGQNAILFPKYIRIFSRHSEQESSEGLNLFAWVADEIAAFSDKNKKQNGMRMYKMLRTSSQSRFAGIWRGLAISYPRHENDAIMKLYNLSQTKPGFYGIKASTFEFNPTVKEEDFKEEKDLDPEDYLQKYFCIPPKTVDAFFKYPERILQCINKERRPIAEIEEILIEHDVLDVHTQKPTGEKRFFVGNTMTNFRLKGQQLATPHVVWVDAGLIKDRACMVLAHGEISDINMLDPETGQMSVVKVNRVVEDLIVIWQPDKSRKLQVSINNIETIILQLLQYGVKISAVGYDQWNSASALETFASKGIKVVKHNINAEDYKLMRNLTYAGGLELLHFPLQQEELERLRYINGRKVDHPDDGSKEVADCLCGVTRLLNDFETRQELYKRMPRSILGPSVIQAQVRPMSPQAVGIQTGNPMAGHPGVPQRELTRVYPMGEAEIGGKRFKISSPLEHAVQHVKFPKSQSMTGNKSNNGGQARNSNPDLIQRVRSW